MQRKVMARSDGKPSFFLFKMRQFFLAVVITLVISPTDAAKPVYRDSIPEFPGIDSNGNSWAPGTRPIHGSDLIHSQLNYYRRHGTMRRMYPAREEFEDEFFDAQEHFDDEKPIATSRSALPASISQSKPPVKKRLQFPNVGRFFKQCFGGSCVRVTHG
jgi:hypothetical protein